MPRPTSTPARRGPVTLKHVAQAAGVSLATASRVLHGSGGRRVAPELADRVTEAADRLRYVAHAHAQSLASSRSTVVGLLVHDIADPYFAAIATGAMRVAREHGLMVLVANTFRDPDLERDYLARLRAQRARAVLLAGSAFRLQPIQEQLAVFTDSGGRVAAIGPHGQGVDTVAPDQAGGARAVARHLHDLGHRKVGVISGPSELTTVLDRLAAFREVYPDAVTTEGDFTRDGGRRAATRLLRQHPDLTAVFALNDLMAAGAITAIRSAGRNVPDDVAVAGFDDLPIATDVTPQLTTVSLNLAEIGARAMELVLDSQAPGRTVPAAATLVVRASTAPPVPLAGRAVSGNL